MSFFSAQTGIDDRPQDELLPDGLLAKGIVSVRKVATSKETGGEMLDLEITISEGPFAKRKLWHFLGSPVDMKNSEAFRKMGMVALTRMFEAGGIFRIGDDASYNRFGNTPVMADFVDALGGLERAFKVGIEKASGVYGPKNRIVEWLTPSPEGGTGFKGWQKLHDPAYVPPAAPPAEAGASTAGAPAGGSSMPGSSWMQQGQPAASEQKPF